MLNVSALWVSQNLSAHDRCQWVASSQELLSSYTSAERLFCRRLVIGDKLWTYHWDPLSKLEFMQLKDVDCPTFTSLCNSAINWLDHGNGFYGIQRDCLWQTICIWKDNYWSVLCRTNTQVTRCHEAETLTKVVTWEFDFFMTVHRLSVTVNLFNWTTLSAVQTLAPSD